MKYKIYFFFFACNMLLGSILGLSPAEKPIPYEDWKTAPYEYVAKEVVPAIIKFHNIGNNIKDQLVQGISTGMQARATYKKQSSKSSGNLSSPPHIALARLVDAKCHNEIYYLPYIFCSATTLSSICSRFFRQKIFDKEILDKITSSFAFITPDRLLKNSEENSTLKLGSAGNYAHSERAIFEKLVTLFNNEIYRQDLLKTQKKYILQIKNSLPMCNNCQNLWLDKEHQDSLGRYATEPKDSDDGNWMDDKTRKRLVDSYKSKHLIYVDSSWVDSDTGEELKLISDEVYPVIYAWRYTPYLQRIEATNIQGTHFYTISIDHLKNYYDLWEKRQRKLAPEEQLKRSYRSERGGKDQQAKRTKV